MQRLEALNAAHADSRKRLRRPIQENVYADSRKTPTQSSHIAFAESRKTLCRV